MMYSIAAHVVMLIHFAFVCFVVAGALLILKWPRLIYIHLPAMVWAVLLEFRSWICPLTPLEQVLRKAAGEQGYSTGFLEHYLLPILYPEGLTWDIQILLGSLLLAVNLIIYFFLGLRHLRKRQKQNKGPA